MDPRNGIRSRGISARSILSALSCAAAEWVVIFLLFLQGFLSYFVRRFARYWNLQPPCLFCSNLDHVFSRERPRSFRDLICEQHRLELNEQIGILEREFKKDERLSDQLPRFSYKEVKVTSDAESEETRGDDGEERTAEIAPEDESVVQVDLHKQDRDLGLAELNWNLAYEKNGGPLKLQTCSNSVVTDFAEGASSALQGTISNGYNEFTSSTGEPLSKVSIPEYEARKTLDAESMDTEKDSDPHEMQQTHVLQPKDTDLQLPSYLDLNEAYKMAIAYKMNLGSPRDLFGYSQSPRVHGHSYDSSTTAIHSNLNRKYSFDRNESGAESLDGGSIMSEIEGESVEERLKRQIEADRKSMVLLYKELEEERNASAIAASQAMAMITRLQEEKALVHMEALQYQRMMEEQSEYDQEALQKKEAEIRDLKEEIERCKMLLGDEFDETSDASNLNFVDDKNYVSEWLKRLESNLHGSRSNRLGRSDEENDISVTKMNKGNESQGGIENSGEQDTMGLSEVEIEIMRLNERLKVLEDDRSFLEHIICSVKNGNGAVQFVKEIAYHLRELRRMGVRGSEQIMV